MAWYVVVTRDRRKLPIKDFTTIDAAGNLVFRERKYDEWQVVACDGTRRAGAPLRRLTKSAQAKLERILYPSLYDQGE